MRLKVVGFSQDGAFVLVEGTSTGIPVDQVRMVEPPSSKPSGAILPVTRSMFPLAPQMARDVFTLDEGEAVLQWPAALTAASVDELDEWVKLVIKKLRRRVAAVSTPSDDTESK